MTSKLTHSLIFGLMVSACEVSAQDRLNALLCSSIAGDQVIATFGKSSFDGHALNCIQGDFVSDMSGCSPEGAYGLHSPTGTANLVRVVFRWQDYADWLGGVTNNYITSTEIRFSGGFAGSGGYNEDWYFLINRLTGVAELNWQHHRTKFSCQIAKRKF